MLTMTAILPWATTRGEAARAKRNTLANMFLIVGVDLTIDGLKFERIKIVSGYESIVSG
jgi:hypothetical protein